MERQLRCGAYHARKGHLRRGYAFLTVMVYISFLSVMGTSLLAMASTGQKVSNRRLAEKQALNLAQGAADFTVARVLANTSYTGMASTALGEGTLSTTVTTPEGQPTKRIITATATVVVGSATATERIRAFVATSGALSSVWYNAIAAKTAFTLNGNITVDSYPTLHQGHIHCNGSTTHNGGPGVVDGNSTATGTITLDGNPNITGDVISGAALASFPTVDQEFKDQSLANGTTTGSVTRSDGSTVQGKILGDLTISGSGGAVNGVVWVTGDVTISGPVTGTGTIVADGTINLNTRSYDERSDPGKVAYISTHSSGNAIEIGGNDSFKGILYAPNATVRFQGNSEFYGIALGNAVTFGGNPNITRWTNFDSNPPPLPSSPKFTGYQEF